MTKAFDLVLFGATGFTGKQTLLHLMRHVPADLKWAIGGRNRAKLEALLAEVAGGANLPGIVTADASDADSVSAMVAQTRVLIQLAGPYLTHGENFIKACIAHGADYVDLTGEIFWVRKMIDQYHVAAQAAGVKIVPVCGFEALPYDLGALLAARHLQHVHGVKAQRVEIITTLYGPLVLRPSQVLSGGTAASMRAMLGAGPSARLSDPAALIQDEASAAALRKRSPYRLQAQYSETAKAWLAPMIPAPFVNVPVLYRSAALSAMQDKAADDNPFEADYEYEEHLSVASFTRFAPAQRLIAEAMCLSYREMLKAAEGDNLLRQCQRFATTRIVELIGPATGQGPTDRTLAESGFDMLLIATAKDGRQITGSGHGGGHPGYRFTATLIAECGLLLATARASLPDTAGILTPALAFGAAGASALVRGGLSYKFA